MVYSRSIGLNACAMFLCLESLVFAEENDGRLPKGLKPLHYNIYHRPFVNSEEDPPSFYGTTELYFRCLQETDRIVFHSKSLAFSVDNMTLSVSNTKLSSGRGGIKGIQMKGESNHAWYLTSHKEQTTPPKIARMELNVTYEIVSLYLDATLKVGYIYNMFIQYEGVMSSAAYGKGPLWATNENAQLAATHFSPAGARMAFPCMDEPYFKATFNMSICRRTHMKSLSNTEVYKTEKVDDNWVIDHYETTPLMSTYLVAYAIHNFHGRRKVCPSGIRVCVWTRDVGIPQSLYSLSKTCQLLQYFVKYTGIEYPLRKLDIISIPDVPTSAMENWGLVIYQEDSLWFSPELQPASKELDVILTLAHEIAHMWFGNLVTPEWWSDVWLKEGFATYFMYRAVQSIHPDWPMENLEVALSVHNVLGADGSSGVAPIVAKVSKPAQLISMFNQQTYAKAASILRMLSYILGEKVFDSCNKKYLWEFAFDSAVTQDYYDVCSKVSGINVTSLLSKWFHQSGFPVLATDIRNNQITYTQNSFAGRLSPDDCRHQNLTWSIPVYQPKSRNAPQIKIITDASGVIESEFPQALPPDQLLVNRHQFGYYRVKYSDTILDILKEQTRKNHEVFSVLDRAQMIDDVYRFSRMDKGREVYALRVTEYMEHEREYLPWHTLVRNLDFTMSIMSQMDFWKQFRGYFTARLGGLFSKMPWSIQKHTDIETALLMEEMLMFSCQMEFEPCLLKAVSLFTECRQESKCNKLNPNIRKAVLCSGVRRGDMADWKHVLSLYMDNPHVFDRDVLLSLACSKNRTILKAYLHVVMNHELRSEADAMVAINAVIYNNMGQEIVWTHLRQQWNGYPLGFMKGSVLLTLASTFCTYRRQRELSSFIEEHPDMIFHELYLMAADLTRENIHWLKQNYASIKSWLMTTYEPRVAYANKGELQNGSNYALVVTMLIIINYFILKNEPLAGSIMK